VAFGKTIESVKDLLAVAGGMVEAAETEIAYLVSPSILGFASQYDVLRVGAKKLIWNGGRVRGITNLSFYYIDTVRQLLDIGEEVRYVGNPNKYLCSCATRRRALVR
jgi:hypothetical protein